MNIYWKMQSQNCSGVCTQIEWHPLAHYKKLCVHSSYLLNNKHSILILTFFCLVCKFDLYLKIQKKKINNNPATTLAYVVVKQSSILWPWYKTPSWCFKYRSFAHTFHIKYMLNVNINICRNFILIFFIICMCTIYI